MVSFGSGRKVTMTVCTTSKFYCIWIFCDNLLPESNDILPTLLSWDRAVSPKITVGVFRFLSTHLWKFSHSRSYSRDPYWSCSSHSQNVYTCIYIPIIVTITLRIIFRGDFSTTWPRLEHSFEHRKYLSILINLHPYHWALESNCLTKSKVGENVIRGQIRLGDYWTFRELPGTTAFVKFICSLYYG